MGTALYRQGDILWLLNADDVTKTIGKVLGTIDRFCEIPPTPKDRMFIQKYQELIMVFSYFDIIGKNEYGMLHVTAITQAIGDEHYLVPLV